LNCRLRIWINITGSHATDTFITGFR
jgi:hypothetical protein